MNTKIALTALSVSLSFAIVAYGDNEPITPSKEPLIVSSVTCDNKYAMAVETAILEGNIPRMKELLSGRGRSINDVIAIGGGRVRFDNKVCTYSSNYKPKTRQTSYYSTSGSVGGQMGIYNGQVFLGLEGGSSFNQAYRPCGTTFGGMGYTRPRGDYYYFDVIQGPYLLGTPLMIAARAGRTKVVAALLKLGANPNVFIKVQDYNADRFGERSGTWKCPRPYLCALFDCYMKMAPDAIEKADEIAKMLIGNGAIFIAKIEKRGIAKIEERDTDDYGRNALWDIARIKSTYLLSEILKSDFFRDKINHRDNSEKTIADYCAEEMGGLYGDELCREFMAGLQRFGADFKDDLENAHEKITPAQPKITPAKPVTSPMPPEAGPKPMVRPDSGQMPPPSALQEASARVQLPPESVPSPMPMSVPSPMLKRDNSVEIAALQHRLLALRMQLEDARANRIIATAQGTGWVTASMHEQQIMQEISDCERQIMQLR